ncbi:UDP-4-amino-4-deoxy-L-arabinose--oxoglutarate aminotransferase [bioreactor metagenome]|uniref:UDP-4-amino-4-deoxy-L-arabinose--oxoglutarate aminotransferase n=1 Tax=bioreactor metagenome TaxID=1076179 RepID=A0A645H8Y9_9ZZZZ
MTDMQAALGLSQLKKSDRFLQRRREIAGMYTEAFLDEKNLITPFQANGCHSSWHLYVIQIKLDQLVIDRKGFFEALLRENIGVNVHYIPVYQHPYYQVNGYKNITCQYSEQYYERAITLPIFPKMSNQDVAEVVKVIKQILGRS